MIYLSSTINQFLLSEVYGLFIYFLLDTWYKQTVHKCAHLTNCGTFHDFHEKAVDRICKQK